MKTRKSTDSQHYVIWTDEKGVRKIEPFENEAYEFMISKLSDGNWACFPENARILRSTT